MEALSSILADIGQQSKPTNKRRMYGGASRRTYEPVRRNSRLAGREGTFWRSTSRKEARTIVLAARKYDLHTKQAGQRSGALGCVAIEILDYFANLVDFRTGRLDPSINTLMEKLKRSRDAICRALKNLQLHGFLDWLRRYVPTGNEGEGPQVQQTSNAYRMFMPARAQTLIDKYVKPAPLPYDYEQAQADKAAMIEEHRQSLSLAELPLFDMGADNPFAQSLAKLGEAMMKKRESAEQTEPLSQINIISRLTPDTK